MRASLNTCLQTDSQLNEGVENDVHGQKKKYNFRKNRSISWTQRAQHVDEQIEPLVDGPYIISLFRSVFAAAVAESMCSPLPGVINIESR